MNDIKNFWNLKAAPHDKEGRADWNNLEEPNPPAIDRLAPSQVFMSERVIRAESMLKRKPTNNNVFIRWGTMGVRWATKG